LFAIERGGYTWNTTTFQGVLTMTVVIERPPEYDLCAPQLLPLVAAGRGQLRAALDPLDAATAAARCLREYQPGTDILTPEQQLGSSEHYQQHVLHVDRDVNFSVVALVWQAGQRTTIHDHLCWGAVAVLRGVEQETLYSLTGDRLIAQQRRLNPTGDVSAFAPPGDIHYVCNPGPETAISLHVYGADIAARSSSIRRNYALDALAA
jgi:predicted metal-dependent enzyme (double-stranded beta helix superfamily)